MSAQHFEGEFVGYWGHKNEWKVFRRSDGFLVGYKSSLKLAHVNKDGAETFDKVNMMRVVTNTKEFNEFYKFVDKPEDKPKVKRYDPSADLNQMRIEVETVAREPRTRKKTKPQQDNGQQ